MKWAELSVAKDVWKSANPEVGQGRTEKDFRPPDAEGMNPGRVAMTLMAEVQPESGTETEAKQMEALASCRSYSQFITRPQLWRRHVSRVSWLGTFCGVNVGKQKGSAGEFSSKLREGQARVRCVGHLT